MDKSLIESANSVDLLALAERATTLKRNSSRDWCGPCPRCGGADRFHVFRSGGAWRWRCYQCHERPADAIAYVRFLEPHLTFTEAVERLTGEGRFPPAASPKPAQPRPQPKPQPRPPQGEDWRARASALVERAHAALWSSEQAQAYLERRALEPQTWLHFRIGFLPDAPVPGTDGKQRAPALVLPWFAGGKLVAVRYRFLEPPPGASKISSLRDSDFTNKLYGGHALSKAAALLRPKRTLILCEGELNCASIWQVVGSPELARDWRVDALSVGAEGALLSDAAVRALSEYRRIIVWMDRSKHALRLRSALPQAKAIRSPQGKDANDLLREGWLGGFLARVIWEAAEDDAELESLLWTLQDAANSPAGLDAGSAQACKSLAARFAEPVDLAETGR